jgi:homoserine O-acetyltransferase
MLQTYHIPHFKTNSGYTRGIEVTYQLFGKPLGTAPIVLVNHALTGNSAVTGSNGWWNELIGPNKAIDTNQFTILAIDILGNGYDGSKDNLISNYKQFHAGDIARTQLEVLKALGIDNLFAVIGGSLGGQIAWELATLLPDSIEHLVPIATDWKATDWVIAQTRVQEQLLNNSRHPIEDARMHAMTFYRTPASFTQKFNRRIEGGEEQYEIESWLSYHGKKLKERYKLETYKLMNHLLGTADITRGETTFQSVAQKIKAQIHLVAIDTDGLFLADEIYKTYQLLQEIEVSVSYDEIQSIHGHDAFLIEYDQLSTLIKPIFQKQLCHK